MTKIVYVKWVDAQIIHGQRTIKAGNKEPALIMESAGIYLSEDEDVLRFAVDLIHNEEDEADWDSRGTSIIPKAYITEMRIFDTESNDAAD